MPDAAWLALRTGAPVVPIVSIGAYAMQPRWQLDRLRLTGRIAIRVGKPLYLCPERKPALSILSGSRRTKGRRVSPIQRLDDAVLKVANQRLWEEMAALLSD